MKNKRIAILINNLSSGGAEKVVRDLVEELSSTLNIELICLEKNNFYSINKNIKVTYLTDKVIQNKLIKLFMIPYWSYKLSKYIKKENIILMQSHLLFSNYVSILSKYLFFSKHKNHTVNHTLLSTYYSKTNISTLINKFLIKVLLTKADLNISVSNIVEQDYYNLYKAPSEHIVIYNPFNVEKIKRLSKEKIDEFKFDNNKKYIICVGRLILLKRHIDIIEVMKYLDDNIELIMLGDGDARISLLSKVKKLGLTERIHFLGNVSNPYKFIKNSNILVVTSQSESFSNVIIESFICKTPVISSDCGGPRELLKNNCGLIYPIGDKQELQKNIESIVYNKSLANTLIVNAYEKSNDFDIKHIIKMYQSITEKDI